MKFLAIGFINTINGIWLSSLYSSLFNANIAFVLGYITSLVIAYILNSRLISFYPSKNLGSFGDGGAITTNDKAIADMFRVYRNYGSEKRYHIMVVGANSRLDKVQAGLLRVKLRGFPVWPMALQAYGTYDSCSGSGKVALSCDYEIIMVDDGSKDRSYETICELAHLDNRIKPVRLSRNFGSHAAILAGLSVCTGDCAVMKAADLQEPSELLVDMFSKYLEGYNVVLAIRADREESISQKMFASLYYSMVRQTALPNMPKGGFDCFLIDRQVIDTLVSMHETNTSLMGQIVWSGFKTAQVSYVRKKREIGTSKWTLKKKLKLVSDSLYGFSYLPVKLISGLGTLAFIGSFIWLLVIFVAKLMGKISIPGYTTLSIVLLLAFGMIMLSIGVLGEYIWRMFDATRNRPPFIIESCPDVDEKDSKEES